MKMSYSRKPRFQVDEAREQIEFLIEKAGEVFKKDSALADRYVEIARSISMKFKVRIKPSLQRRFCKHCYCYLMPGENCRVRTRDGKVVYYCRNCKKYMRFVIGKMMLKKNQSQKKPSAL